MVHIFMLVKSGIFIILGICSIGLLIGIHEFGHLLFAKLFGVHAPSFSIGMGPVIWSKRIGETEYKLSAIPFGGYVEIAGLAEVGQGDQQQALATGTGTFSHTAWWQKVFILSGGVLFHFLLAYLIFIALFMTGMPKSLFYQVESVRPIIGSLRNDSCAQKVNLAVGDEIIAINQQPISTVLDVYKTLQSNKEKPLTVTIKRQTQEFSAVVTPDSNGSVGIASFQPQYAQALGIRQSIISAWQLVADISYKTVDTFAQLFKQRALNGVGGPLRIISELVNHAKQNAAVFLFFLALISINLAILNLIPLPITDGGQIVLTTIETIIRHKIPDNVLLVIHYASWGLIMLLTAYLTIKDFIWLFLPKIKGWF